MYNVNIENISACIIYENLGDTMKRISIKIISLILTVAMTMFLAVPAFADVDVSKIDPTLTEMFKENRETYHVAVYAKKFTFDDLNKEEYKVYVPFSFEKYEDWDPPYMDMEKYRDFLIQNNYTIYNLEF